MRHKADDASQASEIMPSGKGLASRRMMLALTGSALVTLPLGTSQVQPRAAMEAPSLPIPAPRPPEFHIGLTQARAAAEWAHFKDRFIRTSGQVTDNGNGGISHSEGQALGMLFAAYFDEPDVFAQILRWTRSALGRPEDHLLAWCHRPGQPSHPGDRNNATDGDLLAAWALAEAADRWGKPLDRGLSIAMARDILDKTVIDGGDGPLLLPGTIGFLQPGSITVNPSYYVYPAFHAIARLLPNQVWGALDQGGLRLARAARFGRWGLVPDWASVPRGGGRVSIAQNRPTRFSYDAVRVPLYLAWGGHGAEAVVGDAARFWHDPSLPWMPAWADLRTDQISPYAADPGIAAVAQVSAVGSQPGFMPREISTPVLCSTYYAAALRLMAVLSVRAIPSHPPRASVQVIASGYAR